MSKGCDGNTLEHDWLGLRERERDRASKSKRLVQVGALSIVPLLLSIKTIAEFHNKPPSVCLAKEREWRALLFTHRILDVDIITKSNRYVCVCGPTAITGYELSRPKMCVGFGFKTLSSSPREYVLNTSHIWCLPFTAQSTFIQSRYIFFPSSSLLLVFFSFRLFGHTRIRCGNYRDDGLLLRACILCKYA